MHIMKTSDFRALAGAIANLRPGLFEERVTADQIAIALVEADICPAAIFDDMAGDSELGSSNFLKSPLECPTDCCQLNPGHEVSTQGKAGMTQRENDQDDDGVSFISDDYEATAVVGGKLYCAVYVIEEGYIRLSCVVGKQILSKNTKLTGAGHQLDAENLLRQSVEQYNCDLDDLGAVLAELEHLPK